ncbi:unnamed protein product, partial [Chrysoparadoxa australica]
PDPVPLVLKALTPKGGDGSLQISCTALQAFYRIQLEVAPAAGPNAMQLTSEQAFNLVSTVVVAVEVSSNPDGGALQVTPGILTFHDHNWDVPQVLTVTCTPPRSSCTGPTASSYTITHWVVQGGASCAANV